MVYIMFANFTLLAAAAGGGEGEAVPMMGSGLYMIFSLGLMFMVLYFMIMRPQKKKERAQKEMRENLRIGDEVTTIGGITGIIVRKTEDTVVIETGGDKSKIRVKIWAISENATIHDEEG